MTLLVTQGDERLSGQRPPLHDCRGSERGLSQSRDSHGAVAIQIGFQPRYGLLGPGCKGTAWRFGAGGARRRGEETARATLV
jgi:hypothetical protein